MIYDTSNPLQSKQFTARAEALASRGVVVELSERKPRRSQAVNRYLHVILAYFGTQVGCSAEYVKRQYYKILCNSDLFVREVDDKWRGRVKVLRSSADLTSDEMSLSIDRFRNWAAENGYYIPSADETLALQYAEMEVERNRGFV